MKETGRRFPLRQGFAALLAIATGFVLTQRLGEPAEAAVPAPPKTGERVALGANTRLSGRPVKTVLNVPGAMRYGESLWNDRGVPKGPVWVRVDLSAQILSVFRAGHEIGTAVVLHGADKKPTPSGRFPVLAKFKDHKSSIYDAEMPYTLRLTGDGISIHGSDVRYGLASNGCIGLPKDFAAKLFGAVKVGDQVVIVKGA